MRRTAAVRSGLPLMALLVLLVVAALTPLGAAPARANSPAFNTRSPAPDDYVASPALRERALKALFANFSTKPLLSEVDIEPDSIAVTTQNAAAAYLGDRWTVSRLKVLVFDRDQVDGPHPAESDGLVDKAEGAFFDLGSVDMDKLPTLLTAATAYAGLQTPPTSVGVTIKRQVSILPKPSYGEVRITLALSTPRESAEIYAEPDGSIIGGNLESTIRAQRLDLLTDDDWPMAEAQSALTDVLGTDKVYRITVADKSVSVTADSPDDATLERDYSWNLGGVRSGLIDMPKLPIGEGVPFTLAEVDLGKLAEIKAAALKAFASPGAEVTGISAEKPSDRPAKDLQVLWKIDLTQADGETGSVLVASDATIVEADLPASRRPASGPWLDPRTVESTLARVEKTFGAAAKFSEIMIDDDKAILTVEDPQHPGAMVNFIIDPDKIIQFGAPIMPGENVLDPDRAFTMADLKAVDAKTLQAWSDATVKRMELPGAAVFRYTFSRSALMMDPDDNRLLLEIRAGKDDGNVSGWVTYDLKGYEVDVMTP
jgi:hypothetical protein